MLSRIALFCILSFLAQFVTAQVSTDPVLPVATKKVTVTFDSSKESNLGYYTGDLYTHTGVIIEGSTGWKHVIGNWGNNSVQPKLTHKGNGIYELEISPDINTFYGVASNEKVAKLAFVFRSSDANKKTADIFVNVFEEGLIVEISEPADDAILAKNQAVTISANASTEAALKLFLNETELKSDTGTAISTSYTFTGAGENYIIAEAKANDEIHRDSVRVVVQKEVILEPKPETYKKGINYLSDTSVALVLWAPKKNNVYVLGDFNDWQISNEFQMKKDSNYFWMEIDGLEKGKEYIYQYLIDGTIKIADPYTEKTSDPWHDEYIDESTYPGLIPYPEGKTTGIASVLQTAQEPYQWEVENFQIPDKNKLVIYELLIRDFTEEHTYKSVRENLDYLEDLRVNVLELMPVNEFEGNSSWGYNPSFYFAPDKYYGPKNELKKLIDECHKRGIAVVIDMVLNHSYGQSPFVQMYEKDWVVTADNPWYNVTSPNPVFSWGYDFNHEAEDTKELVDSVNSFWINEYKVDGFRFDFTKGFTNTPGDGSAFDQSRINILKRMTDEIWKRKSDVLVILEHFAPNNEETILANYGMMIWGNINHAYAETAMGYGEDLSWGIYSKRGWNEPNLVSYMESHDEERITFKCKTYGASNGDYNIKNLETALDRMELNSVFFLPLPGPKMIWQFGELGYDYSINTCLDQVTIDEECRTDPKPIRWDYLDNTDRTSLFRTMAKLNYLKQTYEEFNSPDSFSYDLKNAVKWYRLSSGGNHVFGIGNFDLQSNTRDFNFPVRGTWYEYFSGDSIDVNVSPKNVSLTAGEFKLFSTRKLGNPRIITKTDDFKEIRNEVLLFPNPARDEIQIVSAEEISEVGIFSMTGKMIALYSQEFRKQARINIQGISPGMYLIRIIQGEQPVVKQVVIEK